MMHGSPVHDITNEIDAVVAIPRHDLEGESRSDEHTFKATDDTDSSDEGISFFDANERSKMANFSASSSQAPSPAFNLHGALKEQPTSWSKDEMETFKELNTLAGADISDEEESRKIERISLKESIEGIEGETDDNRQSSNRKNFARRSGEIGGGDGLMEKRKSEISIKDDEDEFDDFKIASNEVDEGNWPMESGRLGGKRVGESLDAQGDWEEERDRTNGDKPLNGGEADKMTNIKLELDKLQNVEEIQDVAGRIIELLVPDREEENGEEDEEEFMQDRSNYLWEQLIAQSQLPKVNWTRSRIRRLFLVSLGIPLDLDEILPATKQKKLILPVIKSRQKGVGKKVIEVGEEGIKGEKEDEVRIEMDTEGGEGFGEDEQVVLNLNQGYLLSATTDVALENFSVNELEKHVESLEAWINRSKEALEVWERRKENALSEKKVFEGVIENIVQHVKRVRR